MKTKHLLSGVLASMLGLGFAGVASAEEDPRHPEQTDQGLPGVDADVKEGQDIDNVDDPGAPGVDVDIQDTDENKKVDPDTQDADKGLPGVDFDAEQE